MQPGKAPSVSPARLRVSRSVVGLFAVAVSLAGVPAIALDPARLPTQYRSTIWRAPDIPHDSVTCIIEDREGWMWIGTVDGLARFDGASAQVFDSANTPGLRHGFVRDLAEDDHGRIWIGTHGGGLSVYERGQIRALGPADGVRPSMINAIAIDPDSRVWLATNSGLLVGDANGFVVPPGSEPIATAMIGALAVLPDRSLLIAVDDRLMRLAGRHLLAIDDGGVRVAAGPRGLAVVDGEVLVGGHRIRRLVNERLLPWEPGEGLDVDRVWSIRADRDGHVWVGTDGAGLFRFRDGRGVHLDVARGLAGDYVWALSEDRRGNLWIGTNGGGLQVLRDTPIEVWGRREGLPDDYVRAVAIGADGAMFVGTQLAGTVRIDPSGRVESLGNPTSANHRIVRALATDTDGTLWIGTGEGMDRWRDGRYERNVLPVLRDALINVIGVARNGTLWIGTHAHAYHAWRDGRPLALPTALSEHHGHAGAMLVASDDSLWLGSTQALLHYDGRSVRQYDTRHGLPNESIGAIVEGPPGTIWIGTQAGLARWRGGRFDALTRSHGLADDRIKTALIDADGAIWLGSYRGLQRIELANADAVLAGTRARLDVQVYGLEAGLPNLEVNGGSNAMAMDGAGILYVGTRAGLAVFDPRRLAAAAPQPVATHIVAALADGEVFTPGRAHQLPPGLRRIEFRYTALDPARAADIRFVFRLRGFDTHWSAPTDRREVGYTGLRNGDYVFEVRVSNASLDESGIARYAFTVRPYWWQTTWARIAMLLALALGIWAFMVRRVSDIRKQRYALEILVAQRTAEVEAANARLAKLSREDALTGVGNRRRFDEALDAEWQRAARRGSPLALVMIDVDHFKAYNDALGHQAGDICLRTIADVIAARHRRAGELVARYGGEEFVVLLPDTPSADAVEAAERLRRAVTDLALPHPNGGPEGIVTISLGVAAWVPDGQLGPSSIVQESDRALYRAKAAGRNRVVAAETAPPPA